jgi:hypothetical protein
VAAVARGALKPPDWRDLKGLLFHGISHVGNRDIRLNTIATPVTRSRLGPAIRRGSENIAASP